MIKVQLGELRNITEGLNEIGEVKLPIKTAYWIGRIAKKVHSEMETFEKIRLELIKKHALTDTDGQPVIEDGQYQFGDNRGEFEKEFMELATEEIEINVNPLKLDQFGGAEVEPTTLLRLDKFIIDEEGGNNGIE